MNENTFVSESEKEVTIQDQATIETIDLQRTLIEMGFEVGFINKVFTYFQVDSLQLAIDYMTKVDEMWSHPFVNLGEGGQLNDGISNIEEISDVKIDFNLNVCQICGDRPVTHKVNFMERIRSFGENNNTRSLDPVNIKVRISHGEGEDNNMHLRSNSNEICRICLSPLQDPFNTSCEHKYCRDCLIEYIKAKINSSEVEEIFCPEGRIKCSHSLPDELIRSLISDRDLERYEKFLHRATILKIPNAVVCPIPDCDSYSIREQKGQVLHTENDNYYKNKLLKCVGNNHEFCSKCHQPPHPGLNCDHKLDYDFQKWAGKEGRQKVKKCPECSFYIQKNEGCNHMTCANTSCKYEFCWICKGRYSQIHYSNVFLPCYGLQNTKQTHIIIRWPWLRYFRLILIYLVALLALLLSVALCSTILFGIIMNRFVHISAESVSYRRRNFMKLLNILFVLTLGIAFLPLGYMVLALGVACSPCIIIYVVVGASQLRGH